MQTFRHRERSALLRFLLGSSGVELAARFCEPWLSGGLHVAGDLTALLRSDAVVLARLADLDPSGSPSAAGAINRDCAFFVIAAVT
jgi:hypothetical protein